ncbi:MAG: recombinase family protein [Nostocaceae cyanobacterium]|nr:recombinase family protein [Nostocaceae cyanobacterium]
MKIVAYTYSDPLLESTPSEAIWGWEIDRVYQDIGQRRELLSLFHDSQTAPPNYLLIRRLEELGDTVTEVSDRLTKLEAMGITLIATEQPYTSNQDIKTLLNLIQEIQHNFLRRRIRQGHARNRLDAAPPPGKAPYGYRRGKDKYILDRSTATVIHDFFEQFILYGSLRGAVRYLAKKYNKKISVSTGHRWLTNPVYRGDTAYHHTEIITNTHTPIITREEAAQIDRLLRRNRRLPTRTASAPRSLAGLVTCHECQSPMTVARVTTKHQEYLYLRPINCPHSPKCRAIAYEQILTQTIQAVCRDLPIAVAKLNVPQLDAAKNSLTEIITQKDSILQQIPSLIETGILDFQTAQIRAYNLRTEISQLQAQLATLPPVNLLSVAQAVSLPQFWLDLSEPERRFYFREFIRQIEILRQEGGWELQMSFVF